MVSMEIESSVEECSQVDLELGSHRRACLATWKTEMEELSQEVQVSFRDNFPTICRIHPTLRDNNLENYEPKVVSIGPLHRGKEGLIRMDKIKLDILRRILNDQPNNTLDIFFDEVFQCIGEAREEYSEKIELTDEEFAKLLVIDGCFVIVLCSLNAGHDDILVPDMDAESIKHINCSQSDLYLLENQIPFSVVNKLFKKLCSIIPKLEEAFPDCMTLLFKSMGICLPSEKYPVEEDVCHLLHLLCISKDPSLLSDEPYQQPYWHEVMIQIKKKLFFLISMPFLGLFYLILFCDCSGLFRAPRRSNYQEIIPTATKLQESGMNFEMKAMPTGYDNAGQCHISLRDRTFQIPELYVNYPTFVEFRNLIAFEQCTLFLFSCHVTRYCSLLNQLINTHEDVDILRQSRILQNNLGSDSELAEMVNSLCKEVIYESFDDPYGKLREDVQKFCDVPHHKWRASLLKNYFQSPWTFFSVVAATIIVVFTVTQTFFTIFPRK